MPNFAKGIQDSILKELIVKPTGSSNILASGEIHGCEGGFIYIEINEGYEDILSLTNMEGQLFNVTFCINRTTFQLQHNALSWLQKHGLFNALIKNPGFDHVDRVPSPSTFEHKFK